MPCLQDIGSQMEFQAQFALCALTNLTLPFTPYDDADLHTCNLQAYSLKILYLALRSQMSHFPIRPSALGSASSICKGISHQGQIVLCRYCHPNAKDAAVSIRTMCRIGAPVHAGSRCGEVRCKDDCSNVISSS